MLPARNARHESATDDFISIRRSAGRDILAAVRITR